MSATLKKLMGNAGAGFDESHGGFDRLYDVLKAIAESCGEHLNAYQETIATANIGSMVIKKACSLLDLKIAVTTSGSAGSTTIQVHVNGASKGELTVANTEADGTKKSLAIVAANRALVAGDVVMLVVSAAPTAGAGLTASVRTFPVLVEA